LFFPKQFTVGVLHATLDLAALVWAVWLPSLDSQVVLAPFGSLHVGVFAGVTFLKHVFCEDMMPLK